MKDIFSEEFKPYIFNHPRFGPPKPGHGGCFQMKVRNPNKSSVTLFIVASVALDWDHVSVTLKGGRRCPTWLEMDFIRNMFFEPYEFVMQLHPATTNKINMHNYCLHLWRPQKENIPLPPAIMV